ncbi:tetratricopeptide repeat protein [Flavobacterium sp. C4GT6]|uniref:tetratricopeptide repeat protein n=1 Tax=Flavobacterium sp. C4GT6 TaxID=3103818 RepID=UPI002ED387EA
MFNETDKKIIETEIQGLKETKLELIKKLNVLNIAHVNLSDPDQLHSNQIKINEIKSRIEENDNLISEKKVFLQEKSLEPLSNDTKNDLTKAIEIYKQESNKLSYGSTKEDFKRILDLKTKIFDELFDDSDKKLSFVSSKKELMHSSVLFETIYSSETLAQTTVLEIQKIREEVDNYKWYDRSIIVSSLTLSLLNFKFDEKKANLLLDFLTDFETNVWERALVGLVTSIIYQKNRGWQRSNVFMNRLESLQNNEKIQKGLKTIDLVLKNQTYKHTFFNENIYEIDLFKNPMNSFVPFYENNEIMNNAIENAEYSFDIDDFQEYVTTLPLMSSHKYTLCLALSEGKLSKSTLETKTAIKFNNSLALSDILAPYQNLFSEYYYFFNFFPEKSKSDILNKQISITDTHLKKIILNKINQLLIEGNSDYHNKKYKSAISKYEQVIKIETDNKEARWQLGNCYYYINNIKLALGHFESIENTENINKDIFYKIAICHNRKKNYIKSNEYALKLEETKKHQNYELLSLISDNYFEINEKDKSLAYLKKAEEKTIDDLDLRLLAERYNQASEFIDAERVIKEAINLNPKNYGHWLELADIKCNTFSWTEGLEAVKESEKLNNDKDYNKASVKMTHGRILLFSGNNILEAKNLFEQALKHKDSPKELLYGNLGHFYLTQDNEEEYIKNYLECIKILKDKKDFEDRMTKDLKYLINLGISKEKYISIKNQIISLYTETK